MHPDGLRTLGLDGLITDALVAGPASVLVRKRPYELKDLDVGCC